MKKEKKKPNKNAQERSERFWRQMMGAEQANTETRQGRGFKT
nr:hypothetical protein [Bacillus atrophaeus]